MKYKTIVFLLSISTSIIFATEKPKVGIGYEFHAFPSSLFTENNAPSLDIYFPMKANGFTIEPQISFSRSEIEYDYDGGFSSDFTSVATKMSLTVGFLKRLSEGTVESYAGVRIGRISTTTVTDFENPSMANLESEDEALIFAPIFGAEYFISKDFSLGLEAIYYTLRTEDNSESTYAGYWYYNNVRIESTESTLMPKLIMRFYFSN